MIHDRITILLFNKVKGAIMYNSCICYICYIIISRQNVGEIYYISLDLSG